MDRLLLALFAIVIVAPLAAFAVGFGTGSAASESGSLHPKPPAPRSLRAVVHYPLDWLDYYNDHYGMRQRLIHAHAVLSLEWLHMSPSPTVIFGRRGWLYYADDGALEDYESAEPMSEADLRLWADTLVHTRDWLRARGIAYVFALAPDKHVIYPENVPPSIHRLRSDYRLDELQAYLGQHTDLDVVDLRAPLEARKPIERVYHLTDTHWNERGAYVGYAALLSHAGRQVPGLAPLPREAFQPVQRVTAGHDLAQMLGLEQRIGELSLDLVPTRPRRAVRIEPRDFREGYEVARVITEVADPALPRVVVFRDSFGTALIPFLSEHFSRAVYLWQNDFDPTVVTAEHPRLVIQEIVGRRLQTSSPYDAVGPQR